MRHQCGLFEPRKAPETRENSQSSETVQHHSSNNVSRIFVYNLVHSVSQGSHIKIQIRVHADEHGGC